MMEREFVAQKLREFQVQEFIDQSLGNVGHSQTLMKKTPLGEKIIIYASRPSIIVGRRGANIKELTRKLKKQFNLENPQIEIGEVTNIFLDPNIVAERIASSLERYGTNRFKGIGHKMIEKIMEAGARGVEIILSGKLPGARARSWRFYQGYVKKCGDAAQVSVRKATRSALLKPGIVGIRVSIMPPDIRLPDDIRWKEQPAAPQEAPAAASGIGPASEQPAAQPATAGAAAEEKPAEEKPGKARKRAARPRAAKTRKKVTEEPTHEAEGAAGAAQN